jgi:hypothetical protein
MSGGQKAALGAFSHSDTTARLPCARCLEPQHARQALEVAPWPWAALGRGQRATKAQRGGKAKSATDRLPFSAVPWPVGLSPRLPGELDEASSTLCASLAGALSSIRRCCEGQSGPGHALRRAQGAMGLADRIDIGGTSTRPATRHLSHARRAAQGRPAGQDMLPVVARGRQVARALSPRRPRYETRT